MSHRLQILVPKELDARIRKESSRLRISMGEWVRRAIEDALDRSQHPRAGSDDPVKRLEALGAPTGDIDRMLREIESGRS